MLTDNLTVGGLLRRTAAAHPDRPALIHQDQTFTYLELDTFTDRYACSLLQLGVRKGDHVGILCEAEPNCIFLMYAVTRIGTN